jgi:hypothetical protein
LRRGARGKRKAGGKRRDYSNKCSDYYSLH